MSSLREISKQDFGSTHGNTLPAMNAGSLQLGADILKGLENPAGYKAPAEETHD